MADTHAKHHDYHLVNPSPWPIVGSVFAFTMAVGLIIWMRSMGDGAGLFGLRGPTVFLVGAAGVALTMFMWWRDVIKEAHGGDHTPVVQLHLRYGMIMFIASEVMFFVAWFWAYFDASLFPAAIHPLDITMPDGTLTQTKEIIGMVERNALTGGQWPPKASPNFTGTFDPWGLPLVNTLILLLSGTTVTWAHHALLENNRKGLIWGLVVTVILGLTVHGLPSLRVRTRRLQVCGPHLWLHILHGDRVPRCACHHRHAVPARLPVPGDEGSLHAQTAFRVRGGRLVLAFRRRGVAVPVHLHLRDRCRYAAGALTNRHAGAGVSASAPAASGQNHAAPRGSCLAGAACVGQIAGISVIAAPREIRDTHGP